MKTKPLLKPQEVAALIGVPVKDWRGNCHGIATLMVQHKVVPGRAVYGFYLGPVAKTSMFHGRGPFQRHGWILDGEIVIDPTRWVFEDAKPYIYIDHLSEQYDEGMQGVREALMRPPPGPEGPLEGLKEQKEPRRLPGLSEGAEAALTSLFINGRRPDRKLTDAQLFWLANVSYRLLVPYNWEVYRGLKKLGRESWVPIDNMMKAKAER